VGALSIPTMLIQCPGSFIFVYSLAIQPGTNPTSWLSYFVTGTLQGILLSMCIVFHYREIHGRIQLSEEDVMNGIIGGEEEEQQEEEQEQAEENPLLNDVDRIG